MNERIGKSEVGGFFAAKYRKLVGYFQASYADLSAMEVEDLVSDLMVDLLERSEVLARVENATAYIYQAVRNRAVDYLRRRKKTVSFEATRQDADDASPHDAIPEPRYDMTAEIEAGEIRERLLEALNALEPKQRAIWIATECEGSSYRELAEAWGTPVGTLLARKHRANAALQKALADLKKD